MKRSATKSLRIKANSLNKSSLRSNSYERSNSSWFKRRTTIRNNKLFQEDEIDEEHFKDFQRLGAKEVDYELISDAYNTSINRENALNLLYQSENNLITMKSYEITRLMNELEQLKKDHSSHNEIKQWLATKQVADERKAQAHELESEVTTMNSMRFKLTNEEKAKEYDYDENYK
mmetsp:Transcript_29194/g.33418  ORF Transcript_29194/g.33418 Transcript_29194/m.33418 type:complete len:175 (-) Transcript_29194:1638-2162(-)